LILLPDRLLVLADQTDFMTKNGLGASVGGLAQPKCFFAAYDDIREEVIILLEDFGERALTAGDQISGGPAAWWKELACR
jgi:hypothetical protein